ncbi:hypothetical protein K438DRAFT_1760300 [Mycena galopus ATCC 62051]|nr:hypothetical protein K438DRAFT_1760300 [Mycena galopus ATCC 62051]
MESGGGPVRNCMAAPDLEEPRIAPARHQSETAASNRRKRVNPKSLGVRCRLESAGGGLLCPHFKVLETLCENINPTFHLQNSDVKPQVFRVNGGRPGLDGIFSSAELVVAAAVMEDGSKNDSGYDNIWSAVTRLTAGINGPAIDDTGGWLKRS